MRVRNSHGYMLARHCGERVADTVRCGNDPIDWLAAGERTTTNGSSFRDRFRKRRYWKEPR